MELNEGKCKVCCNPSKLRCSNCRDVFYCSVNHQKVDWNNHKLNCRLWRIDVNNIIGRHLIATRDINQNDIIISESPIVWGPNPHSNNKSVCIGCGEPNSRVRCPGCGWYACKVSCNGLTDDKRHKIECKILEKIKIIPQNDILLLLRMMILYKRNTNRWKLLSNLENHVDERRKNSDNYQETMNLIHQLKPVLQVFEITEDIVEKICGIIDVNALETNPPEGSSALYQTACLLEHSCLPNTRITFQLDDKGTPKIIIKAATKILKGEHLTTTYTHLLWSTPARHQHLLATKYFACHCRRCQDPTELDTHLGTLKCLCGPGLMLPKHPLDVDTQWNCNTCPAELSSEEAQQLAETLGDEVENTMINAKQSNLEDLLSRLLVLLHPGHQHCITVSHSLIQLLPPDHPKKPDLCKQILRTTSIVDPHAIRLALYSAIALRELSSCPQEDKVGHLNKALDLLKHEPVKSPGGELKRLIQVELQ